MTHIEIVTRLRIMNRAVRYQDLVLWADQFLSYREASENIREHGAVVKHPRTGAPMPNPYLVVQAAAMRALRSFRNVTAPDEYWR